MGQRRLRSSRAAVPGRTVFGAAQWTNLSGSVLCSLVLISLLVELLCFFVLFSLGGVSGSALSCLVLINDLSILFFCFVCVCVCVFLFGGLVFLLIFDRQMRHGMTPRKAIDYADIMVWCAGTELECPQEKPSNWWFPLRGPKPGFIPFLIP